MSDAADKPRGPGPGRLPPPAPGVRIGRLTIDYRILATDFDYLIHDKFQAAARSRREQE